MAKLFDRAGQQIGSFATTGDTTITLGAALPADTTNGDLITLAAAGAVAGDSINYLIQEGSKWEIGTGALGGTSPTFTLTRGPVKTWSGSAVGTTTPLVFTTAAKVYCVPASGLDNEWRGNFSGGLPGGSGPFILARTVDTYSYSSRMVLDAGGNAYFADNAGGNIGIGFRNNDLVPGLRLPIGGAISWSGINDARDAATTALWQDGANILAQKNNTNGQTFRIYGSADSNSAPVNYTLLSVKHAGGTAGAVIKTEAGGTGTAGSLGLGGATVDLSSYRPASDFQGKISFNYYLNAATGTPTNTWDVRNSGGITMQFWANGSFGFNFDGGGVRTTGMLGFTNSAANGFTTALKETTAGAMIEVNNGAASSSAITNLRDLKIRSLILGNGAAGSITFADGTTQSTAATGGGGSFTGGVVANPIQFVGATASFPMLKRNGTDLEVKLADDTAYGTLTTNMVKFGAAAGAFPALKYSGNQVQVRDVGDTTYCDFHADKIIGGAMSVGGAFAVTNGFDTLVYAGGKLGWSASTPVDYSSALDTYMTRDAAGVIAQRDGANAQTHRIYGSDDGSRTNYSRLSIKHNGGTAGATIATEAGGTGTGGSLSITVSGLGGGSTRTWIFGTNGELTLNSSINGSYFYDWNDAARLGVNAASLSGLFLGSARPLAWSSTTSSNGTVDVGLNRNAAGVLEINNGTAGSFRAIKAAAFVQAQGTLTDAASIAWDVQANQSGIVTLGATIGATRALANPTNAVAGTTYILVVKQDATGSRALTYGTQYKWPGGTAPVLSTAANATDVLTFIYDGTNMLGVAQKAFA